MSQPYKQLIPDEDVLERIYIMVQRWQPQWEKERQRAEAYFALDAAKTVLTEAYSGYDPFQSDVIRQTVTALRARLCENPYTVKVEPNRDTVSMRKDASIVETVMTEGQHLTTERTGIDPQSACSEIARLPYIFLHWFLYDEIYPATPEPKWQDTLEEDQAEADYQPVYGTDADGEDDTFPYDTGDNGLLQFDKGGVAKRRPSIGYRERPEATQQRYTESKAKAGYPWYVEAIGPTAIAWTEDRSLENGYAEVLVRRTMALPSYIAAVNRKRGAKKPGHAGSEDVPVLSAYEGNDTINIHGEMDRAEWWEPSGNVPDGTETVTIYQYWTRDECYEVISLGNANSDAVAGGIVADCFKHPHEMPPFAMCYGVINEGTHDVQLRYEAPVEGLYRLKPSFDRMMTNLMIIQEQSAQPMYYWKRTDGGPPLAREDGTVAYMTRNAADAAVAPEGYELAKLEFEVSPGYVQAVESLKRELDGATPQTGQAPIDASSQPWAIRLGAAQANVEPLKLAGHMVRALTVMHRNMALVMSKPVEDGGTGDVPLYAVIKQGKTSQRNLIVLKPEMIETLDISVEINPTTAAEKIAKTQHGMELLQNKIITMRQLLEDYMDEHDPDRHMLELNADNIIQTYVVPSLGGMIAAKLGYMLGPNGQVIGPGGQPTDPMAMLQGKGYQLAPAGGAPGGGAGQVGQNALPQTSMNAMPALKTPGTVPLEGAPA